MENGKSWQLIHGVILLDSNILQRRFIFCRCRTFSIFLRYTIGIPCVVYSRFLLLAMLLTIREAFDCELEFLIHFSFTNKSEVVLDLNSTVLRNI